MSDIRGAASKRIKTNIKRKREIASIQRENYATTGDDIWLTWADKNDAEADRLEQVLRDAGRL